MGDQSFQQNFAENRLPGLQEQSDNDTELPPNETARFADAVGLQQERRYYAARCNARLQQKSLVEMSVGPFMAGDSYSSCERRGMSSLRWPKVLAGFNDLATVNPELAGEWNTEKNGALTPQQVMQGSSREKVWWCCPWGHEYQATIANRSRGSGCPICNKERKTSFPEQAIWYYLKRGTTALNRYLLNGETEIDVYLPELKI